MSSRINSRVSVGNNVFLVSLYWWKLQSVKKGDLIYNIRPTEKLEQVVRESQGFFFLCYETITFLLWLQLKSSQQSETTKSLVADRSWMHKSRVPELTNSNISPRTRAFYTTRKLHRVSTEVSYVSASSKTPGISNWFRSSKSLANESGTIIS